MIILAFFEMGSTRTDVYGAGGPEILGRLQNFAFLTVVQRQGLDIVERELAEIDLAVLSVAEFHPVIYDAGVVGTHAADVYGLDAAYAAIILDLNAGEITQCVGDTVAVEPLEFIALQCLDRNYVFRFVSRRDHNFLQTVPGCVKCFRHVCRVDGNGCGIDACQCK